MLDLCIIKVALFHSASRRLTETSVILSRRWYLPWLAKLVWRCDTDHQVKPGSRPGYAFMLVYLYRYDVHKIGHKQCNIVYHKSQGLLTLCYIIFHEGEGQVRKAADL